MYTILIVDADEDSCRLCGRHLEVDGCQILVARTKDEVAERTEVECEDCGASWQDVWALVDVTGVKDRDGKQIQG